MGYLDGSTITVDAVLTKQGRRLLARGSALNISSFCLSDTGIDYNLWNNDHPSGSAYYGEALENLPQVEALSQGEYFIRNRLLTLPRGTTALPILDLDTAVFSEVGAGITQHPELNVKSWSVATMNYSPSDTWIVVCPNRQFLIPRSGEWGDIAGTAHQFISAADIPSAGMLEVFQEDDGRGYIDFRPAADDTDRYTSLIFISTGTGAWATHTDLKVPATVTKIKVKD